MTKHISFTKMHGTGNDYIYVNIMAQTLDNPDKLAIQWSAPHTGIGADGLVLIDSSDIADFKMRIFNADGSEAMMCGNASRCIGKYVYEKGLTQKTTVTLETLSGVKELNLGVNNGKVEEITVDMGLPVLEKLSLELEANGKQYVGTTVSMGNPHLVIFVDELEKIDLSTIGPILENNALFPNRINVEFAQVLTPDKIRMRVWERGSGITLACGTGACATAVAGKLTGRTSSPVTVIMDGGSLIIDWANETENIFMTGNAVTVFEGTIEL